LNTIRFALNRKMEGAVEAVAGTKGPPAPFLILGLGNELLKNDAVGLRIAERLQGIFPAEVEVRSTSLLADSSLMLPPFDDRAV
jgi:hypothetical protein